MSSLPEITNLLNHLGERLARIERHLFEPHVQQIVAKPWYSPAEVAKLTQKHGCRSYQTFNVRQACNDGRIEDAKKDVESQRWMISRNAVLRVLDEGIPPERRKPK